VAVKLNYDMTISQQIAKRSAICEEIRLEPDMNREVEFLFDYGSPFSYLANLQIEGFAKRNGAAVTYTPILLGAVLKATGNASPMTIPAKGRHMATELRRWAARYGVAFKPNPHGFMSNTLRLMRGAVAALACATSPRRSRRTDCVRTPLRAKAPAAE
jgi:2-hydroxychromene-2-carboxylate isomerase